MAAQKETLAELLTRYGKSGVAPFHMPGHKRNEALAPYLMALGASMDLTEIPGFDDLHDPEGILAEAMERAARLCGSEKTFFLINGSTGGLLAGMRAATRYGDRVLVARNCHKAVYHGLELCGLSPVFLQPTEVAGFGCSGSLSVKLVEKALEEHPDIRLVILTSPTYEGVLSDVAHICQAAHKRKIPVLVDEAHGAHLGLGGGFPYGAVSKGADLVVQSFHKTLPSLTQTGVIHAKSGLISLEELARQLGIFQSSSPSYLLMASLEGCVSLLEERGETLLAAWRQRLIGFDLRMAALKHLKVLGGGAFSEGGLSGVFGLEPSKLVISTRNTSLSGVELMESLRERYQIQLEMALEDYAVAMTGMGDKDEMMERLADALLELDAGCGDGSIARSWPTPPALPPVSCSLAEASYAAWRLVPIGESAGCVCGEYIWAYPPGIPLIIPGEAVTGELIARLEQLGRSRVKLMGTRGRAPDTVAVLERL